jgi:hypothetical protein
MTTVNIDDLLAHVRQRREELGDGRDLRSDNEKDVWYAATRTCANTISGLMNAPADLARQQSRLDDLDARRAVVVAKEAELEQQLAAAPPWREHPDARERDRRYDHIANLRRQLEHLHAGTLWAAPGVCYEQLDDLDRRIADVRDRRDRAQAALDAHVKAAEAMLAAEQPVTQ